MTCGRHDPPSAGAAGPPGAEADGLPRGGDGGPMADGAGRLPGGGRATSAGRVEAAQTAAADVLREVAGQRAGTPGGNTACGHMAKTTGASGPPPRRGPNEAASRQRERAAWSREQIQQARKTPLPPLLRERGYALQPLPGDNYRVESVKGLVVKRHYWVWNDTGMKGNAIDFFMQIECASFNQAMEILTEAR